MDLNLQVDPNNEANYLLICNELRPDDDNGSIADKCYIGEDEFISVYIRKDNYQVYAIEFNGMHEQKCKKFVQDCQENIYKMWFYITTLKFVQAGIKGGVEAHRRGEV